jgi:hypothetical protein
MSTSTTRSHAGVAPAALAALAALALASCDEGADASLILELTRASHETGLSLYVCGESPASKCKPVQPFKAGAGKDSVEVGVFVKDASTKLNLQLQLSAPNDCAHFVIEFGRDKLVPIALDALSPGPGAPFTVSDCASCTVPVKPCTYGTRL